MVSGEHTILNSSVEDGHLENVTFQYDMKGGERKAF